jgi:hypothetical protein
MNLSNFSRHVRYSIKMVKFTKIKHIKCYAMFEFIVDFNRNIKSLISRIEKF